MDETEQADGAGWLRRMVVDAGGGGAGGVRLFEVSTEAEKCAWMAEDDRCRLA